MLSSSLSSSQQMVERKNKPSVHNEISNLLKIRHPFIAHLFGYFQDETSVNLILEFCSGGELYNRMKRSVKFSEDESKFYVAEIALALDYLHAKPLSLVYRDLKPENVMLDWQGHVKLVDFGFAVPLKESESVTGGCGTAMYIAPEIASGHKGNTHGFPVDWWSCGIIMYEFLTGTAPFGDSSDLTKFEILNNINAGKIRWSRSISKAAKHVISNLLTADPKVRFKFDDIKKSEWMSGMNFRDVLRRKMAPPWIPPHSKEVGDVSNFLNWKPLPSQNEMDLNMTQANVSESLYSRVVGSGSEVCCCDAYDKQYAVEVETSEGRPPPRVSSKKKGGEDEFAATASALTVMKRRAKSAKKSSKAGIAEKRSSEPIAGKGANATDAAITNLRGGKQSGETKFANTASAVTLAKNKLRKRAESKKSRSTKKVHAS